jgi:ABC-type nitrate/sulfonate/bicarbonate transport system substrate-binding protein
MSRSWWRGGVVTTLVLAVAACVVVSATASSSRKADDSLTIAISNPLVNFAQPFVAKSAGLFDKYGVNVTIKEGTGGNTLNMLVTGEADVTIFATTAGMLLSQQGKQMSHIYDFSSDPGSFLIGAPGINSVDQAKALGDKCTILGGAAGSQGYGYAVIYKEFAPLGLSKCNVESTPSSSTLIARMAGGQATLASVSYSGAKLAMDAYGAKILINPNLPGYRKKYQVASYMTGGYYGAKDNLQSKRPAVVKFLEAIDDAAKLMVPKNLAQLTTYLKAYSSFSAQDFNSLRTQLQNSIRYIGAGANVTPPAELKANPNALKNQTGWISKPLWDLSLKQYAKWQVPGLDLSSPVHQYSAEVDMSYLTEALKAKQKKK